VTARLFVAIRPDADTIEALGRLVHDAGPDVRLVPEASWHVTLRFLGDVDTAEAAQRLERLDLPPTTARLGPEVTVLGRHLVVPVSGVDDLADAVDAATVGLGEPPRHPFSGHLTLGSAGRSSADLVGRPIARSFQVDEIHLLRSEPGRRYDTVTTRGRRTRSPHR